MKSTAKKKSGSENRIQQKASYSANKKTELFLEQVSKEAIKDLYEELVQVAEKNTEQCREESVSQPEIQCRAGCSHCCHMRVHVTPIEILHLADQIREVWTEKEIDLLIDQLDQATRKAEGLDDFEYGLQKIRCPLLDGDNCGVYKSRPFECRGYVSFDVQACITAANDYNKWDVPMCLSQFSIFKGMQAGMSTTLAANDYEFEMLEFTHALKIALKTEDISQKWLEGEGVFSEARLDMDDPDVVAMLPWTNSIEE